MSISARRRVSRDDWLKAALEILSDKGVEAVKIDHLARRVGVAKTGFYWHFENRRALLDAMLEFWEREYTEVLTRNPVVRNLPPAERLQVVSEVVEDEYLPQYNLAIDLWARDDEAAARIRDDSLKQRLNFVREAFRELGFAGDELEMRTRMFVCYVSNAQSMFGVKLTARDKRMRKLRNRLLVQHLTEK